MSRFLGKLGSPNVRDVSGNDSDSSGASALPFIIWTTILSIGIAGGGFMGRRFFF